VADPKIYAHLHVCYYVKFGSSATKGVRTNRREPNIGERWGPAALGWGVGDPNKLPPHNVNRNI